MDIQKLKEEYLKNNSIKYLDYYGNVSETPRPKKNTYVPQGILTIYKMGDIERVL